MIQQIDHALTWYSNGMKRKRLHKAARLTAKTGATAAKAAWQSFLSGKPAQLAAGIAYYGTLAFFPLMAAMVAMASLVLSEHQIADIVYAITTYMPGDIASLLGTQLHNAASHHQANLIVMIFSILFSIFGVSGAIGGVLGSIRTIYNVNDTRPFWVQRTVSLMLTIAFIVGLMLVLPLVFIGGNMLATIGVAPTIIAIFSVVRWILLVIIAMTGMGVLYHYALPDWRPWRWLTWGSILATTLWVAITAIFFIYLQKYANFSSSYSLFAGVIALMMWINFGAFAVLIGASVDYTLEKRGGK